MPKFNDFLSPNENLRLPEKSANPPANLLNRFKSRINLISSSGSQCNDIPDRRSGHTPTFFSPHSLHFHYLQSTLKSPPNQPEETWLITCFTPKLAQISIVSIHPGIHVAAEKRHYLDEMATRKRRYVDEDYGMNQDVDDDSREDIHPAKRQHHEEEVGLLYH